MTTMYHFSVCVYSVTNLSQCPVVLRRVTTRSLRSWFHCRVTTSSQCSVFLHKVDTWPYLCLSLLGKNWSQCSMFLCKVVTWTCFSMFPCRLRPYHNDMCPLQGDHLIAQCVYNSEGRSTITLGGLTTREEMCLVFALYYPRIDMSLCHSLPSLPTVLHSLGIRELWSWVLICLLIVNFDMWFDRIIHSAAKTFIQAGK
jgi:hypothetical protein